MNRNQCLCRKWLWLRPESRHSGRAKYKLNMTSANHLDICTWGRGAQDWAQGALARVTVTMAMATGESPPGESDPHPSWPLHCWCCVCVPCPLLPLGTDDGGHSIIIKQKQWPETRDICHTGHSYQLGDGDCCIFPKQITDYCPI